MSRSVSRRSSKSLSQKQLINLLVYENTVVLGLVRGDVDLLQEIALEVVKSYKWPYDFDPVADLPLVTTIAKAVLYKQHQKSCQRREVALDHTLRNHPDSSSRNIPTVRDFELDLRDFLKHLCRSINMRRGSQLKSDVTTLFIERWGTFLTAELTHLHDRHQRHPMCSKRRSKANKELKTLIKNVIKNNPSFKELFSETLCKSTDVDEQRANLTELNTNGYREVKPARKETEQSIEE